MKPKRYLRRAGLRFYAKIKLLDGKVLTLHSCKKMRVSSFVQANSAEFKYIYIKVTYKEGIYNDGKYYTHQLNELWNAWKCFTEETFIKEVLNDY